MNVFLEFDFSQSWISTIFEGLRKTGRIIQNRTESEGWFDGLHALEHFEELFGVACVLVQTYMNRTWGQIQNANRKLNPKQTKWQAIPLFGEKIKDLEITNVELIYHLANYWKHSDEWKNWDPAKNESNFQTIQKLSLIGINKDTEYPCVKGFEELNWFKDPLFVELEDTIYSWRDMTAKNHLAEGGC